MSEYPKRMLSALMVMGAQSPGRAMSSEELAERLGIDKEVIETELKSLVEAGYASAVEGPGTLRVYLTGTGIISASSTYS